MNPVELRLYHTLRGNSPVEDSLFSFRDLSIRGRIRSRIDRLSLGLAGDVKSLRNGIYELRLHFGAGYRIYYGKDGQRLVILLCGGDKGSQKQDIKKASQYWKDYLRRKL